MQPDTTTSKAHLPRSVLIVAAVYVLAWSLLPPLLSHSFPLDVVESLTWGREWQWGNYKHPPLAPWVLHLSWRAFGAVGPYLLSQMCIAATLWFVWRTGCRLMTPERALLGTVLTMGVVFYTRPALEFNHNIAQMPIWAALGFHLLAALQDGRLRHWLALGLWAGLGLLTKYSVAIMLATLGLYLLVSPARQALRQKGPWLALGLAALVVAPHVSWLVQTDWLPLAYARDRADDTTSNHGMRWSALDFLITQALNHLPLAAIALASLVLAHRKTRDQFPTADWRLHTDWPGYLLKLSLASGLLVTALGMVMGLRLRDMWGVPMWAFSGLLVAAAIPGARLRAMRQPILRGTVLWLALASLLSGAYLAWGGEWRQRPARTDWPAAALGTQAQGTWDTLSKCPLDTVAGNYWLAGLVAVTSSAQPSVLIYGNPKYSPWITPSLLQAHGALWIWQPDVEPAASPPEPLGSVAANTPFEQREGQWSIPWSHDRSAAPLVVRWRAYIPQACAKPGS